MAKYMVTLSTTAMVYGNTIVEARSSDEAEIIAVEKSKAGRVIFDDYGTPSRYDIASLEPELIND